MPIARAERVLSQRSALWRRTGEARKQVLLRRRRYAQGLQVSRGSHEREEVSFAPTSFCSVARGCLHVRSQKYRYLPIEWNVGGPLLEVQAKRGMFCCWSFLQACVLRAHGGGNTRRPGYTWCHLHTKPQRLQPHSYSVAIRQPRKPQPEPRTPSKRSLRWGSRPQARAASKAALLRHVQPAPTRRGAAPTRAAWRPPLCILRLQR